MQTQLKQVQARGIPVYQSILETLKQQILSVPSRIHFLSESQIIKDFDVSATTARKVLNELESMGLVRREQGRGSIVVSPHETETNDLAVIFFNIYDPKNIFISDIIQGIQERTCEKTTVLHLLSTGNRPICENHVSTINHLVTHRKLHGLFILSPIPENDLKFLAEERMPFVILYNKYPDLPASSVIPDYRKVIFEICDWLVKSGRSKIGIIASPRGTEKIQKSGDFVYEAYTDSLKQRGHPFRKEFFKTKERSEEEGYEAMAEFLAMPAEERPQAIIATQATIARGVLRFTEEQKEWRPVVIPFSEQPIDHPHCVVEQFRQMGRAAFELMERQIREQRCIAETLTVPFNFVVSENKGGDGEKT